MNTQITKWGSIQPTYARNGEVLSEIVTFHANGNPHKHKRWEICTVIRGKGSIIQVSEGGKQIVEVKAGSGLTIPPETSHWMEVESGDTLVISIVYTRTLN